MRGFVLGVLWVAAGAACGGEDADGTTDPGKLDPTFGLWLGTDGVVLHVQGPSNETASWVGAAAVYVVAKPRGVQNPKVLEIGTWPGSLAPKRTGDTLVARGVTHHRIPTWPEHEAALGEAGRTSWITPPVSYLGTTIYDHVAVQPGIIAAGTGGVDADGKPNFGISFLGPDGREQRRINNIDGRFVLHPDGAVTTYSSAALIHFDAAGVRTWEHPTDDVPIAGVTSLGASTWVLFEGGRLIELDGDSGEVVTDLMIAAAAKLSHLAATTSGDLVFLAEGDAAAEVLGARLGPYGPHTATVLRIDRTGKERWRHGVGPDPGTPMDLRGTADDGVFVLFSTGTNFDLGLGPVASTDAGPYDTFQDLAYGWLRADGRLKWQASSVHLPIYMAMAPLADGRVVAVLPLGPGYPIGADRQTFALGTWLIVWDACGVARDAMMIGADCGCTFYPGQGSFLAGAAVATDDHGLVVVGGGGDLYYDLGTIHPSQTSYDVFFGNPAQGAVWRLNTGPAVAAPECPAIANGVRLQVVVAGPGSVAFGAETCTGTCSYELDRYAAVTLVATAGAGQGFAGWTLTGIDAECAGEADCTFFAAGDVTVTARFEPGHVRAVVPLGTAEPKYLEPMPDGADGAVVIVGDYEEGFTAGAFSAPDTPGANKLDYTPHTFVLVVDGAGSVRALTTLGAAGACLARGVAVLADGTRVVVTQTAGTDTATVMADPAWSVDFPFHSRGSDPVASGDAFLISEESRLVAYGGGSARFDVTIDHFRAAPGVAAPDGAGGWWVFGQAPTGSVFEGGWKPGTASTYPDWLLRIDPAGAVTGVWGPYGFPSPGPFLWPVAGGVALISAWNTAGVSDGQLWVNRFGQGAVGAPYALAGLPPATLGGASPFGDGWLVSGSSSQPAGPQLVVSAWSDGATRWTVSYGRNDPEGSGGAAVGMAPAGAGRAVLTTVLAAPTRIGNETFEGGVVLVFE